MWCIVRASRNDLGTARDEVTIHLMATAKTVYRLVQPGEMPEFKLGGIWRFRRTELDRWIGVQIVKKTQNKT